MRFYLLFLCFFIYLVGYLSITKAQTNFNSQNEIDCFCITSPYPNPANNYTEVSYKLCNEEHAELVLYNITGERLTSIFLEYSDAVVRIPLTKYNEGLYFISIIYKGKTICTKKLFIK